MDRDQEEPFHTITKGEVWRKITHIDHNVTEILKGQEIQNGQLSRHDRRLEVHSSRIRSLDFKFYGVLAGLVAGVSYIVFGG